MIREACAGSLLIMLLAAAVSGRAEVIPPKGAIDVRVRTVRYDSEQVYRIHGYIGYQIDFEFEAGESFVGLGSGDIEGLSYFGQENHLFLKPKAAEVATNLTVLTNRRRYQIDYTADAHHPTSSDPRVIYTLRFTYPPQPAQSAAEVRGREIDAALSGASAQRLQNTDYWYCGSRALKPVAASDDGIHTRLRFAPGADLPAIFVRNPDGVESLLNFSMDGADIVVHRVAERLVLRRGKLAGCVVNRRYGGNGERLDSGTVSPHVHRDVPQVMP